MNSIYDNDLFENLTEDFIFPGSEKESSDLSLPLRPEYSHFYGSFFERKIEHLRESPLALFKEKIEPSENNWGAHFHGFGKGLVKGSNLTFRAKVVDGKKLTELDFKINHVYRKTLQQSIEKLEDSDSYRLPAHLERVKSKRWDICIKEREPFPLGDSNMGEATKIKVGELGTIYVGSSPELPTMYNRIVVRMDEDKVLSDFYELLALLELEESLELSGPEDLERLKIGHLFRTFYPRESLPFERSEAFFLFPLEQLKEKIIEMVPEMEGVFDRCLGLMTPEEILPGKLRYRIHGLAQRAFEKGARGLTAAITGAYSDQDLFEKIASILKTGMMSSETRKSLEIFSQGLSSSADFYSGGADSVFTQMVTEKDCSKGASFGDFYYTSDARLLISLDVLETGTYQYLEDSYGNRHVDDHSMWKRSYLNRLSILEFIEALQSSIHSAANGLEEEWDRVKEYIRGILENERRRAFFEKLGIIRYDEKGRLKIQGMFLNQFLSFLKRMFRTFSAENSISYAGHEIMLKERIAPSYFKKILVSNPEIREGLIRHLEKCSLIQYSEDGKRTVLGYPVDQFILVENKASESLFV